LFFVAIINFILHEGSSYTTLIVTNNNEVLIERSNCI